MYNVLNITKYGILFDINYVFRYNTSTKGVNMKRFIEHELNEEEHEMVDEGLDQYIYIGKEIDENELKKIEKELEAEQKKDEQERYELDKLDDLYNKLKNTNCTENREKIIKEAKQILNNPKKIKDTDIHKKFGIPISTLQDWKNREKDNWRKKIYLYLKKEIE